MNKIIIKYLTILTLTFLLVVNFTPQARAQLPFFNLPTSSVVDFPETPNWDLNKAEPCGKYWCSNVYFFGNADIMEEELTVALPRETEKTSAEIAIDVEQRAKFVQNIFEGIFQNITQSDSFEFITERKPLKFWQLTKQKPRHPLTPIVEVGTENDQTVIYVPRQPDLGLASQAIVTVTAIDANANASTIELLAQKWRTGVQDSLSDALWGLEMNHQQPFLRLQIVAFAVILLVTLLILVGKVKGFFKKINKVLRQELDQIKSTLTTDPEAEKKQYSQDNLDNQKGEIKKPTSGKFEPIPAPLPPRIEKFRILLAKLFNDSINTGIQAISDGLLISTKILPKVYQEKQNIIKQQLNLIQLILRVCFLSQIMFILLTLGTIVTTFRETRYLFNLFFSQAILLPLIWILMVLTDKLVDFWIDSALNHWAKERQELFPHSNRPTLRVNTYSPALQGATTFLFTVIGISLTFTVTGINPSVVAGAGAAAVVFAFLSRNLLEDMLNGVLILFTDRFAVGDVVEINGLAGAVETMNLYATSLRNLDGQLIVIPNGHISTVINMTKNWSRVNFTIEIAWNEDTQKAINLIDEVAQKMYEEEVWQEKILEPADILGIEKVSHDGIMIRLLIKTLPAEQWTVARELRFRVKEVFAKERISLGIPQREIWHHDSFLTNS
ncbi:MAG: mechanosensitive ion channel family protein [Cyanobacterium sp. T60_A2020_053]|nr:mechanosensitive ion channel family protein [Cyanobacterium sp. T60_A2020_053]